MEMTPVDFTTDVIVELSTTHFMKSAGKIFHLMDTAAPSARYELCFYLLILFLLLFV